MCDSRALKNDGDSPVDIPTPSPTLNEPSVPPTSNSTPTTPPSLIPEQPSAAAPTPSPSTGLQTVNAVPGIRIVGASSSPRTPAPSTRTEPTSIPPPESAIPPPPSSILQQPPTMPVAPPIQPISDPTPSITSYHGPPDGSWAPDTAPGETGPAPAVKPRPRPRPVRSSHPETGPPTQPVEHSNAIPIDPTLLQQEPLPVHHTPPSTIQEAIPEHRGPTRPVFGVRTLENIDRPSTPPPPNLASNAVRSPFAQRQPQQHVLPSPPRPSISIQPAIGPIEHAQRQRSTEDVPLPIDLEVLPSKMAQYCRLFVGGKGSWGESWARCVQAFVRVEEIDGSPVRVFPSFCLLSIVTCLCRLRLPVHDSRQRHDLSKSSGGSSTVERLKTTQSATWKPGPHPGGPGGRCSCPAERLFEAIHHHAPFPKISAGTFSTTQRAAGLSSSWCPFRGGESVLWWKARGSTQ